MVINYTRLNDNTIDDSYQIPNKDMLLNKQFIFFQYTVNQSLHVEHGGQLINSTKSIKNSYLTLKQLIKQDTNENILGENPQEHWGKK